MDGGRPIGAYVDVQNERMLFGYPPPFEYEVHVLKFDSPVVVMHSGYSATHIYRGNPYSASCRKVYIAELSLNFVFSDMTSYYGMIRFPMWAGKMIHVSYRVTHIGFETERDGLRWLEGDVIPSW